MAIIKLCNDILWVMENQQLTAFIAIDLSAAFDTVDHDILLKTKNKIQCNWHGLKTSGQLLNTQTL